MKFDMRTAYDTDKIRCFGERPGVYFLLSKNDEVLYVGKAIKLSTRLRDHKYNSTHLKNMTRDVSSVGVIFVDDIETLHDIEKGYILKNNPPLNISALGKRVFPKSTKKAFTTYVSQEVLDELRLLSAETRVPAAQYIEEALKDLLNKYSKPIKEDKQEESGVRK